MSRKLKKFVAGVFCACLIAGCGQLHTGHSPQGVAQYTGHDIVVDAFSSNGKSIQLHFHRSPNRIVAVWQNSVETILALEAGDRIVAALGVPHEECLKPEYRAIYNKIPLKQFQLLDTEHILMLEPDFILGWSSTFSEKTTKTTDFWLGRGINTYFPVNTMSGRKQRTIDDEYKYIIDIGTIVNKREKAEEIVQEMQEKISYIQTNTLHRTRPRALIIEQMRDSYMVYGANSLAGDILRSVNGEIIAPGKNISYEEIIEANPDVIFMVYSENNYANAEKITENFINKAALQDVNAIKNKRIYNLPLYVIYGSATRTYDGICMMAAGLYPDLFGGQK